MTLQFQTQHILTNISSETKRTTIELVQETTYRQIFRWYDSDTIYQAENKIRKQATTSNYSLFLSSFIRTHLFSHLLRYTLSSLLLSRSMYLLCYAPNEPFLLPLPEIRSLSYQNRTKSNRLKFRPGSSAGEARQTLLCKYEQDFCFPWVNQLHRQSPSLNILLLQKFHGY